MWLRFLKGVLSGWFAVRHGWLRGGTWLFLGLAIAGLVDRIVVSESLLTAMLPIPFLLAAACVEFDKEQLAGGIANLGKVVQIGDTVRRAASAYTDWRRQILTMAG
jgi:hypothetical protein